MYYFDTTYIILVMPAIIFSLWASARVKSTFKKYSRVLSSRGITGAEAAAALLRANDIDDVSIEPISGQLSDHYDPKSKVARLSVYNDTSVAAIGVACHEIGHAIQHNRGYAPLQFRNLIVPITNFGARLSWPLIIVGLILSTASQNYGYYSLVYAGILCFSLCVFFQLVTLPVEFNASRRAIKGIKEIGLLDGHELVGAEKVLKAAALTYVAAMAVSLAQLLRMLIIFGGGRRD